MNTGKEIFFGLALIALAIFATDIMKPANAGPMGSGRYMGVSNSHTLAVWVVDTETGSMKYCNVSPEIKSSHPKLTGKNWNGCIAK
jgi:hypothetical protein